MSFPRILAITGRVISQFRRDHRTLGLIFVVPLVVMSLLGYVFRAQESDTLNVAIVNEDKPPAGQASLAQPLIDSLKTNENLTITEMSRADAVQAVRDGKEKAGLVFKSDFTQQFLAQHKSSVEVIVEGSNPGQASGALAQVGRSLQQSAPVLLKSLVPPAFAGLVPTGSPLDIQTTRLYGRGDLKMLDFFAPIFIAYIAFFLIFLLTSVSFLRERTQGTMERLAASPVTRIELVLGYMFGFGFFALIQSTVLLLFTIYVLQVKYTGNLLSIFLVTLVLVVGAVNLGIFLSAFARNELQAVQFIPLVILPQILLSGLLWPVQDMPGWLQAIAKVMPLTYAVEALTNIMIRGETLAGTWVALTVLVGFAALAAIAAAGTVRRQVA
jgi:ABC-2 type transport system permease protein